MVPILYQNIFNAIRIESTMEAGNSIIISDFKGKNFYGADAVNTIMQSLSHDLSLHLSRLYDIGVRNRHVNKRDVASIPLLIRLLRQKRCQNELAKRARNWLPTMPHLAEQFESDCLSAISSASQSYSDTFRGPYGRSGLKLLKEFRDNFLAHSLMKEQQRRPIYLQLFRLNDCARNFIHFAQLAVTGNNSDLKDYEEMFRKDAEHFWRRALNASFQVSAD
ncbi:hypothetical protein [Pleomorphomonas sp. JP5]|uniref:AbiU2 domain-containing protein n=1 Tax=Pleomorphomonas sp. JP5 TaxID=2942998 RepID=UPI002042C201|nr:hypothetical protein [Pleomorphomonas sp. JP5]MCM5559306.1 hypothetical protein [Pleomorphomonas sp. JP5]